jgi:peroxiredoxin
LRDRYGEFLDLGAEVVAVSAESLPTATLEVAAAGLPFPVLSDDDLSVIGRYGVAHDQEPEGRRIARPSAFLIDGSGVLRFGYVGEHASDRPAIGVLLLALETMT